MRKWLKSVELVNVILGSVLAIFFYGAMLAVWYIHRDSYRIDCMHDVFLLHPERPLEHRAAQCYAGILRNRNWLAKQFDELSGWPAHSVTREEASDAGN